MHVRSVAQSLTLWDPGGFGAPGCSVHGILQARILVWATISSSGGIFPVQGWYLSPLHWQVDSLPLSHLGNLDIKTYINIQTLLLSEKASYKMMGTIILFVRKVCVDCTVHQQTVHSGHLSEGEFELIFVLLDAFLYFLQWTRVTFVIRNPAEFKIYLLSSYSMAVSQNWREGPVC